MFRLRFNASNAGIFKKHTKNNIQKTTDIIGPLSIHIRSFVRAVASDEPVYIMAHPSVSHIFEIFDRHTLEDSTNKDMISFHSPLLWKLTKFCSEKNLELPNSFYALVRQLGTLSQSFALYLLLRYFLFVFFVF